MVTTIFFSKQYFGNSYFRHMKMHLLQRYYKCLYAVRLIVSCNLYIFNSVMHFIQIINNSKYYTQQQPRTLLSEINLPWKNKVAQCICGELDYLKMSFSVSENSFPTGIVQLFPERLMTMQYSLYCRLLCLGSHSTQRNGFDVLLG